MRGWNVPHPAESKWEACLGILTAGMGWMIGVAFRIVAAYEKSIVQYPNIKPGEEFNGYKRKAPKAA